ncbi:MAG: BamA/TamA family outer membrane protein [Bacteroidetes bacterium]|nr:BamA/TamA family outer membrane protein [Bacteroidota bacterium]
MGFLPFIKKNIPVHLLYPPFSSLVLFLSLVFPAHARTDVLPPGPEKDSSGYVIVDTIRIEGCKQTRLPIILRELPFRENDTITRTMFPDKIRAGKENIFNTSLFTVVTIDTVQKEGSPDRVDVIIHLAERWYVWPKPYFEISDRNFNTWIQTWDFSRLTYGINLTISNVRGRNETLILPIHFGFNQKIGFGYKIPYVDRKKIVGIAFGTEFNRNHEVIVKTENNKTVYYKDPDHFPRENLYAYAEVTARATFYARHTVRVGFNDWYFSDSLIMTPGYAADSNNLLNYFSLYYQYKNDHRDVQYYPLKGSYFDVELDQNGLWSTSVSELYIKSNFRKYIQISNRWYFATGLTAKVTFTPQPPYFLQRGLGYGRDFVRGYEYYVVDGKDFILWKNNFKFAILPEKVYTIGGVKSRRFNPVPFAIYMNLSCDLGYVNNTNGSEEGNNDLRNSILVGYGAGIDFTTYYDIVIRLDFSLNSMGEPGLYLHFMAPI